MKLVVRAIEETRPRWCARVVLLIICVMFLSTALGAAHPIHKVHVGRKADHSGPSFSETYHAIASIWLACANVGYVSDVYDEVLMGIRSTNYVEYSIRPSEVFVGNVGFDTGLHPDLHDIPTKGQGSPEGIVFDETESIITHITPHRRGMDAFQTGDPYHWIYLFPLGGVDPASVRVGKKSVHFNDNVPDYQETIVMFDCKRTAEGCLQMQRASSFKDGFIVPCSSEEDAQRLVNAFRHLAEMFPTMKAQAF